MIFKYGGKVVGIFKAAELSDFSYTIAAGFQKFTGFGDAHSVDLPDRGDSEFLDKQLFEIGIG